MAKNSVKETQENDKVPDPGSGTWTFDRLNSILPPTPWLSLSVIQKRDKQWESIQKKFHIKKTAKE